MTEKQQKRAEGIVDTAGELVSELEDYYYVDDEDGESCLDSTAKAIIKRLKWQLYEFECVRQGAKKETV